MAKQPAKPRTTVDLYVSTRELLKQIIAIPGNGQSQPVMIDILVRAEAARLRLIEGPKAAIVGGPIPKPGTIGRGRGRQAVVDDDGNVLAGPMHEGKCPKCGDDLRVDLVGGTKHCTNPACDYRC